MNADMTSVISKAYDLSNILRVCVRALEGDARHEPGDEVATAYAVRKAQEMAGDVISSLERNDVDVGHSQPATGPTDCAAMLYGQWEATRKARVAVLKALGPNHKDDPVELDGIDDVLEALSRKISQCKPQTHADAAAMLEWCILDSDGAILCEEYTRAQRSVIEYLRTVS
jgi:hypothetical protein